MQHPSVGPSRGPKSCTVFVGNIPYEATEEQLKDVFRNAGPVVSLRLVADRATGKPKGFGFCRFRDPETALSAIRNLNNHDFNGRSLRVDFADEDKKADPGAARDREFQARDHGNAAAPSGWNQQDKTEKAPQSVGPEAIQAIVAQMPRSQQLELLAEMKRYATANRESAKKLLVDNPQLAQCMVQLQILYGMIHSQDIQRVTRMQPLPAAAPPPFRPPLESAPLRPAAPTRMAPPMQPTWDRPPPPTRAGARPPPVAAAGRPVYRTGPPPALPVTAQEAVRHLPENMQKVLLQLLKLSPQQIAELPPKMQQQVHNIRMRMQAASRGPPPR